MGNKPIYVTQPLLPDLESYIPYLQKIWDKKWLTNNGEFHQELEQKLCEYLGVNYISLFNNGTIALVSALQALRITGHVITTPYSFVATSNSLIWNGIKPIFVDVTPEDCNIDVEKIEAAITPQTTAIMAVHCYGNPCNVKRIKEIADIYGLKVIYDAAHSFAVEQQGNSILNHGDISVLSFHATKVFNTFEGGAIVCQTKQMKDRIDCLKNFGILDETTVIAPGINGKMNELQAAFGLLQLKSIDDALVKRQRIDQSYRKNMSSIKGIRLLNSSKDTKHNYSYFPIFIEKEFPVSRDEVYKKLKECNIFSRRYFYPLLSNLPMYRGYETAPQSNLPQANILAEQVLCLPIHTELTEQDVRTITGIIKSL